MTGPWDLTEAREWRRDWLNLVNKTAASTRIPANPRRKRLTREMKRARIAQEATIVMGQLLRHSEMTDRALVAEATRRIARKQARSTR